ncbi:MAG: glycosyltransferase family 39 protein [Anaerolineae bacterium]|nr:glycosyltransferase family 39 protein [Anaerolineae bacterium]
MSFSFSKSQTLIITVGLFLLALAVRLPYLGSYMTIDEVKWIEGAGQFTTALAEGDLFATYWHFHPGITVTWGEALVLGGLYLTSAASDLTTFISAQMENLAGIVGPMRLSPVIITALTVVGVYGLARPLLGNGAALLGAALLAVDPFFVGHSRIVNGDAGAAGLMMLSFLAFAGLWQRKSWLNVVLAGIMGGLAVLTKLPAPIIFVWLALLAIMGAISDRRWRFWLIALVATGAVAAMTFILLFPAMWVDPLETLRLMYVDAFNVGELGEGHDTFFLGQVSDDPGWLFYPVAIAYRLTLPVTIGLLALLVWPWLGGNWRKTTPLQKKTLVALVGYVIFIWLFANASPKKLDRYVMGVIPPLLLLAGFGLNWLVELVANRLNRQSQVFIATAAALLIIVVQVWPVITNYPYVLTFYNPLLGGFSGAVQQVPVGWGAGMEQAATWINAQPKANQLNVSSWYSDMVRPYLNTGTTSFSSSGKGQLEADYVIFYINQAQRQKPNETVYNYFRQKEPVFRLDYRGTPYVWVYPAPGMQVSLDGDAVIEGRARLLGYNWLPVPPSQPGDSVRLTLFLRTTGPLPDNEAFRVALAASDGSLWGQWEPIEPLAWQTDALLEWSGVLTLPADAPPDEYRLVVQLIDKNIDSEVTRFPHLEPTLTIHDE